ncbi:hypothetical protein [Natrialba asiatica]|uniref:Uncharacterized protein n=1 Tax=Natrialba asiatica (strain ATCC 700177 / DSM 12278 / JCM 9576 / FERM P-10747 / NBRC 102637 / 172P1) TaxID=29540 RepID=M0AH47_NATA1|nr:hypothetical protein [Natrialba asiatica]ELY97884.1 hypothetical protein C481_18150 [Natrialba asiatica DSM 12278]
MELAGRTLRDRIVQALVVFLTFLVFQYFQNSIEWGYLVSVAAFVFVFVLLLDAATARIET